jgi:methylornithine synthase
MTERELNESIQTAMSGRKLSERELKTLLTCEDPTSLFEAARDIRDKKFGRKVYTYGFVYFSTYCRNNCSFCYYRHSNGIERYRRTMNEIADTAESLVDSGVDMVDLTMGEDTRYLRDGCHELIAAVEAVKDRADIPIMVSPGVIEEDGLRALKKAGADWYACYQETYNRDLYSRTRLGQDFDMRMEAKRYADYAGLLTEEGIMTGIGESTDDLVYAIDRMRSGPFKQVRAMTFVPQKGAPLLIDPALRRDSEQRIIAVMRLACPDRLIPASMDVEGVDGLRSRLDAGANVVTSIVPPDSRMAGVAQHEKDIANGNRTVEHIGEMLADLDYEFAPKRDYYKLIRKWEAGE